MMSTKEEGAVDSSLLPSQAYSTGRPTDSFHYQGPHSWLGGALQTEAL